ncbi:unnamed protein product [Trifolium pratense]|uniref:Uncharacterized protein n=1 Tax=Trifolium pratense TaxID=57577 RepID=A0ACB0K7U3_TRIPR|nr:unnamed protein product [Trifolium pratense]
MRRTGPIELQFDPEIEKTARANRKAARESQASREKASLGGVPDCQEQSSAAMEEEQDPPINVPPIPQPQRRTLGDYGRRDNDALANQEFVPSQAWLCPSWAQKAESNSSIFKLGSAAPKLGAEGRS